MPTHSVFSSFQLTIDFASESSKPPSTNAFAKVSNSRLTVASAPPRDSDTMQWRWSGHRQLAPFHTQLVSSAADRASRSSTVSHAGESVAYDSIDVRRQMPRTWSASCQKL